jgi:hypothetical protein
MARVKDSTATTQCIKRYKQLLIFLNKLEDAMTMPMTLTQRRGTLISSGRMLNNIVCVFTISNEITDRVLNSLNTMLMNMASGSDNMDVLREETTIIGLLRDDITRCVTALESSLRAKDIQAMGSYT